MPQRFLYDHGINIKKDIKVRYVGSQESSIMGALNQTCLAAATWPPPWEALKKERREIREKLKIVWETEPLINNGLVFKNDLPKNVVDVVREVFLNLHKTDEGVKILKRLELSKFEPASNKDYQKIKKFIENFT